MRHLLLLVLAGCGQCKRADPPVDAAPALVVVSSARDARVSVTPAPSCTPIDRVTLDDAAIGFRVTDLVDVAVAAANDEAVITFAVDGNHGCDHDGCFEQHRAFAIDVDHSKTGRPYHLTTSAAGISPSEFAAPGALGSDLFVFTKGFRGAAGVPEPGHDAPGTEYQLQRNKIAHKWPDSGANMRVTASAGAGAWGVGLGETEAFGPYFVRAFHFESGARTMEQFPATGSLVDAPGVAASPDHVVVVFRGKANGRFGGTWLYAVWLDPATAKPIGTPEALATGDVGAPTVTLGADTADFVWAQKTGAAYVLMRASWAWGDPKPSAGVKLAAPASGLAPALARAGNGFALAWTEGDEKGTTGKIYAGFGDTIDAAAASAILRSSSDVKNARDPEWASSGTSTLLVWSEHDGPRRIAGAWCR